MVALVVHKDLRLVLQPAEGVRVDDTVAVTLERRAQGIFLFRMKAAARSPRIDGIGRPPPLALTEEFKRQLRHAPPRD
jgi:hypothetical protein